MKTCLTRKVVCLCMHNREERKLFLQLLEFFILWKFAYYISQVLPIFAYDVLADKHVFFEKIVVLEKHGIRINFSLEHIDCFELKAMTAHCYNKASLSNLCRCLRCRTCSLECWVPTGTRQLLKLALIVTRSEHYAVCFSDLKLQH